MERKNELDFSIPMRQSYAAILIIAYRLYKVLLRQLFPLLIIFLFGGSLNKKDYLIYGVIALAVLGFIYSVVSFFKYYFYLKEDKLIVRKGVFKKSTLEIPFDRIQSINYEQNLIHRIFNVVRLNMDTAGSSASELQLNALDHELAKAISDHILTHKTHSNNEQVDTVTEIDGRKNKKKIFSLSLSQLLKVGITANHLRSGGIIVFFFFWIWENLREIGQDFQEQIEDKIPVATEAILGSLMIIAVLLLLFVVAAFIISLVRTVLKYYGLNMFRIGNGFVIESGLFNRREHAAKDDKIQLVSWSQNLLQKWANIFELRMKQASSLEVSDKKSIQVAGLEQQDILDSRAYLFKESDAELDTMALLPVNKYYRFRRIYYWSLILLPIAGLGFYMNKMDIGILAIGFYLFGLLSAHLKYKKKKYGVSANMLLLQGGTFGSRETMMRIHKIQNITLHSTPFQRRRALSSLILHTASGSLTIPDISELDSIQLKNQLLYQVENTKLNWM